MYNVYYIIIFIFNIILYIMNKLFFYSHQGWTDIINCLPLLNYYKETECKNIYYIVREDAENLVKYYTKDLNINIILIPKEILDRHNIFDIIRDKNIIIDNNDLIKFHGMFDNLRRDKYNLAFTKCNGFFSTRFYTAYNINPNVRINYFNITRNIEVENNIYNNFIIKYGTEYILTHGNININKNNNCCYVKLDEISTTFFDMITVLLNAKEIHVIDSIWAVIIFLLETRYNMFLNKNITIYCNRGYYDMFRTDTVLNNIRIV